MAGSFSSDKHFDAPCISPAFLKAINRIQHLSKEGAGRKLSWRVEREGERKGKVQNELFLSGMLKIGGPVNFLGENLHFPRHQYRHLPPRREVFLVDVCFIDREERDGGHLFVDDFEAGGSI
mmetsp:Transcript_49586/g.120309  ORF Transcript_49586/g.120309 Transcript_49586/m.120309 type:complete len:122 (-) Transcript_49586:919-1284(-)